VRGYTGFNVGGQSGGGLVRESAPDHDREHGRECDGREGRHSAVTQPISGTITANAGSGTFAVSAAALPLPTGASTAAKQPALGTAGTASTDVISVQGIAAMTPLLMTLSGTIT